MKDGLNPTERIVTSLGKLYSSFGYSRFKMCKFEEYDIYVSNKDFLLSSNVITFNDTNGKLMALKPDVTLSIVKNAPKESAKCLKKVYYNENVYRVSSGSKAFKEIMQTGLECIGELNEYALYEVLYLAEKSLSEISDNYILDVSHMGLLSAFFDYLGLDVSAKENMLAAFKEKNLNYALSIIADKKVSEKDRSRLITLLSMNEQVLDAVKILRESFTEDIFANSLNELYKVLSPINDPKVKMDFSAINDMKYYNGLVFRGYVEKMPRAVLSGGCYDALMQKMGKNNRAVGFAVYADELDFEEDNAFDFDVLILVDNNTDISVIAENTKQLVDNGESVCVQCEIPQELRFKRTLDLRR